MKESKSLSHIKFLYGFTTLDYDTTVKKTKLLLSIYKGVCWKAAARVDDFYEQLELESKRLDVALEFLMDYSCEMNKSRFMSRISSHFKSQWLVEVIDEALNHVAAYPDTYAKTYKEIIKLTYLEYFKYDNEEIHEMLNLERSTYFAKKKEAIALLGLAIWSMVIPKYVETMSRSEIKICELEQLRKPALDTYSA